MKTEPRFLAHLTPTASELLDVSFGVIIFFVDAPPIPRLVDLVHVFKGVVVEQFKKRLEKLLSDSIPLWRLLVTFQNSTKFCFEYQTIEII